MQSRPHRGMIRLYGSEINHVGFNPGDQPGFFFLMESCALPEQAE
jgi:hypothetical protein